MAKAGYLPDISGVFSHWRKEYLDGLKVGRWSQVSLGLHNMNGSLDEDYRLEISTEKWEQKTDSYIVWECQFCTTKEKRTFNKGEENEYTKEVDVPTRSKKEDIEIFEEECSLVVQILSGSQKRKMWQCPKCKQVQSVDSVETLMMRHVEPHFRDCIYAEPARPLTGLMRRRGSYPEQMKRWSKSYSHELEHKLALYRLEYIKQHDGEDMEYAVPDKGD